jgi:hypothetical protein
MKLRAPRRPALLIGAGGFVLILVAAGIVAAGAPADAAARSAVSALAFDALGGEADAFLANDQGALKAHFTGPALQQESAQLAHVQKLITDGTDYPGALHLSGQKVLSISGGGDSYTVEVQFHAVRDNMKGGAFVDQSVSDVIWTLTVVRTDAGWRISEMSGRFAPGGGP